MGLVSFAKTQRLKYSKQNCMNMTVTFTNYLLIL